MCNSFRFFIKIAVLSIGLHVSAFSAPDISKVAKLVPQHVTDKNIPELTECIQKLSESKDSNDALLETLIHASPWKATFAMTPNNDKEGRFLPFGQLTITKDTIQQYIDLNILSFCFEGKYYMSGLGNKMNIEFTSLQVSILGWHLPPFDISNDASIVRYARGGGRKRPNTYLWHFVNDEICVARGSSGNVAMWQSVKAKEELG